MPKILDNFINEYKLQTEIDKYFKWADDNNKPYSMAMLAVRLGVSRQTLYNYEEKDNFAPVIRKARDKIIAYIEEKLLEHGTAGQIFLAKNYGYSDRQEILANNINTNNNGLDSDTKELLSQVLERFGK